jgi:hypothetical protein
MVPTTAKIRTTLEFPIEVNDPSEGVRSQEIPDFFRDFFDIIEWRPYGGQVVDLVMPCLDAGWAKSPEGYKFVDAMLRVEEDQLAADPRSTHHLVAYGRLKPLHRLMRPLRQQAFGAAARRLERLRRRIAKA